MGQPPQHSSVHLLEDQASGQRPSPGSRVPPRIGPGTDATRARRAGTGTTDLRAPGFVLLGAASIFEGYRWLGAIPANHDLVSRLLFNRSGAAVFAVLALAVVVVLTGNSSIRRRLVTAVALPATAVAVVTATLLLAVTNDALNQSLLGAADLVMAVAALAALVSGERRARPGPSRHATGPAGRTVPPGSPPPTTSGDRGANGPSHSIPVA